LPGLASNLDPPELCLQVAWITGINHLAELNFSQFCGLKYTIILLLDYQ
jgi:hypothetical protein